MEKNEFKTEPTFTQNAETLWEQFEKTGSIETYLKFVQKVEDRPETVPSYLPS